MRRRKRQSGSGGDRADRGAAGLQLYGLRQVQVPREKKAHEAKLKQKQIQVKEVKFRPGTDEGDYKIKLRNLIRFLEEGDKTKVTLRFRGREMAHQEFGIGCWSGCKNDLERYGVVEQFPKLEGRQMVMVLAPKKKLARAGEVKQADRCAAQASGARCRRCRRRSLAAGYK